MLLVGVLLSVVGCDAFEGDYRYGGRQLIVRGAFRVSAVFHTAEIPVVMATRRVDDQSEMNLFSLAAARSCVAGRYSRYLAAGDGRGFRLSMLDVEERTWEFFDQNCRSYLRVDNADRNGLHVVLDHIRNLHQYLVIDQERVLWAVDPFAGTQTSLVAGITGSVGQAVSASLLVLPGGALGLWVVRADGLQLISANSGEVLHRLAGEIIGFDVRGPYAVSGGVFELVLLTRPEGTALFAVGMAGQSASSALLWEQEGACRPRFQRELSGCLDGACNRSLEDAEASSALLSRFQTLGDELGHELPPDRASVARVSDNLPWVGMESPCGSADLKLRPPMAVVDDLEFPGAMNSYALVRAPDKEGMAIVFLTPEEGFAQTHFVTLGGDEETLSATVDLTAGVGVLRKPGDYRVLLHEEEPRWGVWRLGEGFVPFLDNVAIGEGGVPYVRGDLVLHDLQDGEATLSRCLETDCSKIADGVYPAGYWLYLTEPRIGEQVEAVAFLRDYDTETRSGELLVSAPELGVTELLDTHVDSYRPVEVGPARGIVYSVRDEARRGLWFAPR